MIVIQFLALLLFANGSPVIAKRIFEEKFIFPLDAGMTFLDGRPLFGKSKTIRGFVAAIATTTFGAPIIGLDLVTGLLVGISAMAGDLLSSFIKRRLNLSSGSMALGLDQIPESLIPLLVCQQRLGLSASDIFAAVLIFFIGELVLSRILYKLHIRDHPY